MDTLTLDKLRINEKGVVGALCAEGSMRRRMIDIGIVDGTEIECVGKSPSGDPSAYLVRGAVIAIRAKDARKVCLREAHGEARHGTY